MKIAIDTIVMHSEIQELRGAAGAFLEFHYCFGVIEKVNCLALCPSIQSPSQ